MPTSQGGGSSSRRSISLTNSSSLAKKKAAAENEGVQPDSAHRKSISVSRSMYV